MKVMRKKLINQQRDIMKQMSRKDLVDHILDYHNVDILDYDEEGNRREKPIAMIAENIRRRDYVMSDAQYYTLLDGFTKITIPEMKVVGTSFRDIDGEKLQKDLVGKRKDGVVNVYEVDYMLEPEPDNPYDPNAVKIYLPNEDGIHRQHIGYVAKDFLNAHPILEPMIVEGTMEDHSNGKFKNLSFNISFDTEALDARYETLRSKSYIQQQFDFNELLEYVSGPEDLSLDDDMLADLNMDDALEK